MPPILPEYLLIDNLNPHDLDTIATLLWGGAQPHPRPWSALVTGRLRSNLWCAGSTEPRFGPDDLARPLVPLRAAPYVNSQSHTVWPLPPFLDYDTKAARHDRQRRCSGQSAAPVATAINEILAAANYVPSPIPFYDPAVFGVNPNDLALAGIGIDTVRLWAAGCRDAPILNEKWKIKRGQKNQGAIRFRVQQPDGTVKTVYGRLAVYRHRGVRVLIHGYKAGRGMQNCLIMKFSVAGVADLLRREAAKAEGRVANLYPTGPAETRTVFEHVQKIMDESGLGRDVWQMTVSRLDVFANRRLAEPWSIYGPLLDVLFPARMKMQAYGDNRTFSNQSRALAAYNKSAQMRRNRVSAAVPAIPGHTVVTEGDIIRFEARFLRSGNVRASLDQAWQSKATDHSGKSTHKSANARSRKRPSLDTQLLADQFSEFDEGPGNTVAELLANAKLRPLQFQTMLHGLLFALTPDQMETESRKTKRMSATTIARRIAKYTQHGPQQQGSHALAADDVLGVITTQGPDGLRALLREALPKTKKSSSYINSRVTACKRVLRREAMTHDRLFLSRYRELWEALCLAPATPALPSADPLCVADETSRAGETAREVRVSNDTNIPTAPRPGDESTSGANPPGKTPPTSGPVQVRWHTNLASYRHEYSDQVGDESSQNFGFTISWPLLPCRGGRPLYQPPLTHLFLPKAREASIPYGPLSILCEPGSGRGARAPGALRTARHDRLNRTILFELTGRSRSRSPFT